jgi:hypothetical protein
MIRRAGIIAFTVVLMLPAAALATTPQGMGMMRSWAATNRCAQQAQKAFPDYTPESNAKRDARLRECLAASNLPPRPSLEVPAKP